MRITEKFTLDQKADARRLRLTVDVMRARLKMTAQEVAEACQTSRQYLNLVLSSDNIADSVIPERLCELFNRRYFRELGRSIEPADLAGDIEVRLVPRKSSEEEVEYGPGTQWR